MGFLANLIGRQKGVCSARYRSVKTLVHDTVRTCHGSAFVGRMLAYLVAAYPWYCSVTKCHRKMDGSTVRVAGVGILVTKLISLESTMPIVTRGSK